MVSLGENPAATIGFLSLFVLLALYFARLRDYNINSVADLPRGVLLAVAFGVLPLSHAYHLFVAGEQSIVDYCPDYKNALDYTLFGGSCGLPLDLAWDSAFFDTWEFTVAHEVLLLKTLAAVVVMFSARSHTMAFLVGVLLLEGIVGWVLFSTAGGDFMGYSRIWLLADLLILVYALYAFTYTGD